MLKADRQETPTCRHLRVSIAIRAMLDFIWHLRGSISLDSGTTDERALDRVERLLEKQRKGVSDRGTDYVAFDDPLWSSPFGPNWLAMVIYDRGRFWTEKGIGGRR